MDSKARNKIIEIINETKTIYTAISDETDLQLDLGIDSLAFIKVLLEIESVFSISFSIFEMGDCLILKNLIAIVENKIKEA